MHSVRPRGRWHCGLVTLAVCSLGCAEAIAPSVEIVLSEPSVDFRAIRGTTLPVSKTIAVENGGDGRLGPVSCPANPAAWLACSVSNANRITLTANPTGLTTSPAGVSVPITADGAPDASQSVTVNLIVDQPVLTVSTSTVDFIASETGAGTTPASATVTVTNSGAGTLSNLGAISCVPTPATTRVACAVNQNSGVLTFTANPAGVAPGTYVFPVVVSAPNDNVSKTVTVTLAVSAVPRISLSQQALVFQMIRGSTAPAPQTVTVTNVGGGSLGTVSCPTNPASWLTCAVSGGGSTLTFVVNVAGLTVSPTGVSVPVSATGATNSPQSVTVNLTIRQPVLSVSKTSVTFAAVANTNTTTPASATVTVTNSGEGSLSNLGTITCTPPNPSPVTCAVSQTTGDLTITVNPAGLVGTKLYEVEVTAPNSSVSRIVTVSLSAAPGIALSPGELNFQALRGSTTNVIKKVKVTNAGSGTLGTISCPANPAAWLTCAVITGDTLVFTAKPNGLTTSPAEVLVPVAATGAFNNPQTVTVNFTILQPVLTLSQSVLSLSVQTGSTTAPANVTVTNSGAGTLPSLGTISCTPSDAHVACAVNQSTGVLTVTVNSSAPTVLVPDKYVYTLTVTSTNMGNAAQTVAIVLTVTP